MNFGTVFNPVHDKKESESKLELGERRGRRVEGSM